MCTSQGGDGSHIAKSQRQAEEERQRKITEGTGAINQQFARFDEPFFKNVEQAALDFYIPQLESQFGDAREKTIKRLAREGNLEASAGIGQLGDLTDTANLNRTLLADKSRALSGTTRANIEDTRSRLLGQLQATADPAAAATAAHQQALAATAPPEFSPIGDLFSKFLNQGAVQIGAARQGFQNVASPLFGGGGSGFTVVNT